VRALFDAKEPIAIDIEYEDHGPAARGADGDRARDIGRRGCVFSRPISRRGMRSNARALSDVVHDSGAFAERPDVRGGDRVRRPERENARTDAALPIVRRGGRCRQRRGPVAGHREPQLRWATQPA
jgi:hypothetical protein